jgi:hypothetical protein
MFRKDKIRDEESRSALFLLLEITALALSIPHQGSPERRVSVSLGPVQKPSLGITGPGVVAHACNPRYSRGRDQEDCSLRPAQAKQLSRLHLNKETGSDGCVCNPSHVGGRGARIVVSVRSGQNETLYEKRNQSQQGCSSGSSGRAPA